MIYFAFRRGRFARVYPLTFIHVEIVVPVPCAGAHYCDWCKRRVYPDQRPEGRRDMHFLTFTVDRGNPVFFHIDKHWVNHHNNWVYVPIDLSANDVRKLLLSNHFLGKPFNKRAYVRNFNLFGHPKSSWLMCGAPYGARFIQQQDIINRPSWFCSEMASALLVYFRCAVKNNRIQSEETLNTKQKYDFKGWEPCQMTPMALFEIVYKENEDEPHPLYVLGTKYNRIRLKQAGELQSIAILK